MFAQRARKEEREKINEVVSHQNGRVNTELGEQRGGGRTTGRERKRRATGSISFSVLFVISGGMLSGAAAVNL